MFNEENRPKTFHLVSFIAFFCWLLLGASLFVFPMMFIGSLSTGLSLDEYMANTKLVNEHTYIIGVLAHTIGTIVFTILYKKTILDDLKLYKQNWLKYILITIIGFILLYGSGIVMNYIYELLGLVGQTSQNQQGIIDALHGSTVPFVIIYTVILAPIFEEIVFRKLFFNVLRKYTKLPIWAIVLIISAVFAFIHVTDIESIVFFPQYFVLALIITSVYAITKENLIVSTGLHFLNNIVAVIEILVL